MLLPATPTSPTPREKKDNVVLDLGTVELESVAVLEGGVGLARTTAIHRDVCMLMDPVARKTLLLLDPALPM